MPLQSTSGAASYDAFGGGAAAKVNYIEDFSQSYLRTGTGASATVTTGLDGSTKKTLVWTKSRSAATNHKLTDNVRGATKALSSNTTGAEATDSQGLTAFSATGYTIGTNTDYNNSGATYVDWQWVAQPKFFDVVTYTGNGVAGREIPHNLGSVPGCIILKSTSEAGVNWNVFHRSIAPTGTLRLNLTDAQTTNFIEYYFGNDTAYVAPTSTVFTVGGSSAGNQVNGSGATYVAYLFAHNAGGFGLTGTDNVISCGLTTANGSGDFSVNLGYEPQWVLIKSTGSGRWSLFDNMRGVTASSGYTSSKRLQPHLSDAEDQFDAPYGLGVNATGFTGNLATFSNDFIYIAIRRGPMKVPTSGTSVFSPIAANSGYDTFQTTGFPIDTQIVGFRAGLSLSQAVVDRLRGVSTVPSNTTYNSPLLSTSATTAETTSNTSTNNWNNTGFSESLSLSMNDVYWNFRRAPSFFDEVCYTGTGSNGQVINHNLSAIPEMVIIKGRDSNSDWFVYQAGLSSGNSIYLNRNYAQSNDGGPAFSLSTTALTISRTYVSNLNSSGVNYVAYLFATCDGVSKVFSYTGNGSSQTINCGFTGGARFVLIKRTDADGDWYEWDSARGIVSGNDPYLLLNSTAAEVTNTDYVDTYSAGFEITSTAPAAINASGGSFIFLAIA